MEGHPHVVVKKGFGNGAPLLGGEGGRARMRRELVPPIAGDALRQTEPPFGSGC